MTFTQQKEFEMLGTPQARAAWLLDKGVTASLDIDPPTLALCWRACACGVMLPAVYFGSEQEAINHGIEWLQQRAKL